jgi:hypothetical protein
MTVKKNKCEGKVKIYEGRLKGKMQGKAREGGG